MRQWLNLFEDTPQPYDGSTVEWFWINPTTKQILHVDGTHTLSAIYDLGLYSPEEQEEVYDPDSLEDQQVINKAINAGWVRGRYGEKNGREWDFGENNTDMSLQGTQRNVVKAARLLMVSNPVTALYVDFESGHKMDSIVLKGKRLDMFLKTGHVPSRLVQEGIEEKRVSIEELPFETKQDIIVMLLENCPSFEEYWMSHQSVMTFNETYVSQFIFGYEIEYHPEGDPSLVDDFLTVGVLDIDPQEIDNTNRSVSDNVVRKYAALKTTPPMILVRRIGNTWKIVEGGHRIAAAKMNGSNSIPAVDVSSFFTIDWETLGQ